VMGTVSWWTDGAVYGWGFVWVFGLASIQLVNM